MADTQVAVALISSGVTLMCCLITTFAVTFRKPQLHAAAGTLTVDALAMIEERDQEIARLHARLKDWQ